MTEPYTIIIRRFLFLLNLVGVISLDRNYQVVINLSFVLPGLHLNILKTEKMVAIWGTKSSRRAWQEVKVQPFCHTNSANKKINIVDR